MNTSFDDCDFGLNPTINDVRDPASPMERSHSNISSVFISPGKQKKKDKQRFIKIKEKVLHPGSDMSHSVEWSSFMK